MAAFDDIKAYYGYFDNFSCVVNPDNTTSIAFDSSSKTVRCPVGDTIDEIIDSANEATGGAYAKVFTDSNLTEVATDVENGNVLVVTSPGGSYDYYTINTVLTAGITSNNLLVQVLNDSIAVLSHPDNSSYYISSAGLINSLNSSLGYSVSYVDADKNDVSGTVSNVKDGFIKLSKDGAKDVYIPIVTKGASLMEKLGSPNATSDIEYNLKGGLGGKTSDDLSHTFTVGDFGVTTGASMGFSALSAKNNTRPFTIEFNVYIEGDVDVSLNIGNEKIGTDKFLACQLYHFTNDGKLYYLADNSNDYGVKGGLVAAGEANTSYEKGRWKHVAIVYDGFSADANNPAYIKDYVSKTSGRSRYKLYIDGVFVSEARKHTGYDTAIPYFSFNVISGTAGSKAAFADIDAYYGYYYPMPRLSLEVEDNNEDVMVNNSVIYYNPETIKSFNDFESKFITDADIFTYFTDGSFSHEATSVSETRAMVISSNESKTYAYYEVAPMGVSVDSVEFKSDSEGNIYAEAIVSCIGSSFKNAMLVIALYDDDGAVYALTSSAVKSVNSNTDIDGCTLITPALNNASGLTPKAFVISDWTHRVGISEMYFAK